MPQTPRRFRAAIFDMDGVLTDSEPAFHAAVNDILSRYGHHISLEDYARFVGSDTPVMWAAVREMFALPASLAAIIEAYDPPLMQRLREPRPALPGARALIESLHARGVPVALCTASRSHWVEAILASAKLTGLFDTMATADMVERTKPDPAPYLLAASKLDVQITDCLVVEDSVSGVAAAVAAGATVLQLRATSTSAQPQPGIERVITSLAEFPLDWLASASG